MPTLTKEVIEAAIQGFEAQKHHIDSQIAELRAMLPSGANGSAHGMQTAQRAKSRMSAAGRKAIAEAQRKRWAAVKNQASSTVPAKKSKRKLSAAGRANIVAALKKRWAAKKAEGSKMQAVAGGRKVTRKAA
jgi:hypothetical protein